MCAPGHEGEMCATRSEGYILAHPVPRAGGGHRLHQRHGATVRTLSLAGTGIGPRALWSLFHNRAWPQLEYLDLRGAVLDDWEWLEKHIPSTVSVCWQ